MFPGLTTKLSVGNDIASAATIYPDKDIHVVSGTAEIANIVPKFGGGFSGILFICPTGAFTWVDTGNIALAGTAVAGKLIIFVYNDRTSEWYPSVVA